MYIMRAVVVKYIIARREVMEIFLGVRIHLRELAIYNLF